MVQKKKYSFITEQFSYETVELKGGAKKHFVTGYISNTERDVVDDIVTKECLKSMLSQINSSTIALDFEHEAFRDDPTILPVGKIIDAKIDDRGLWVKAELNTHSPKFEALWGSIKDGFLKAFSIAFKPIKTVEKAIGNTVVRLLEDLQLLNVALTATPVNTGAVIEKFGMKSVVLKAINEVENMSEEQVEKPAEEVEQQAAEESEAVEQPSTEAPEKEAVEAKSEDSNEENKEEENKESEDKVEEKSVIAELKALREQVEKQNAELKSIKEKSVFKSKAPEAIPEQKSKEVAIDVLSMIK